MIAAAKWSTVLACVVACGGGQRVARRAPGPEERPIASPAPAPPRLVMLPPAGDHRWVEVGSVTRGVEGGIRYERDEDGVRVAESRFYSKIVRASRVDGGWLFVAADGVVARSDEFLGALERLGEIPVELGAVRFDNAPGGVCIVDRLGSVHLVRDEGLEPAFEPMAGETAVGCAVMPGEGPLPARALVWLDGGDVVRLDAPATPIDPPADLAAVGEKLVDALVRERREAHGLPDPIDGAERADDTRRPPVLSLQQSPAGPAIREAEALRGFRGEGVGSQLAWLDGDLFDLDRGEWVRFGECSPESLRGTWLLLGCGSDDQGELALRATRDGREMIEWPWDLESHAAGPEHALRCPGSRERPRRLDDCSLVDRSGRDVTPAGWADAPGAIVAAFGTEAIALEEIGSPRFHGPRSEERPVGGAFGSMPDTHRDMRLFVAAHPYRAHHFDGERWQALGWVGDAPDGVFRADFAPDGTIIGTTWPPGIAAATDGGLTFHPVPAGASRADTFDGKRGVAAGERGLWWTADGGQTWHPVELPTDGEVADRPPSCGAAGCVVGRFALLWDAEPSAIPPLHRPANVLTRIGAFAPLPPRPDPGRGLEAIRCDAPLPQTEWPAMDGDCAESTIDGTRVHFCIRERELEVRLGRGRRIRHPMRWESLPYPDQVRVVLATRDWAFLVAGSHGIVVAPRGVSAHRRTWRGVLARLDGRGAQRELRVETQGNLFRFDRRAERVGLVRRVFEDPWVDGLTEAGDLVVGASDGTLRVYDARTGEESERHELPRPVAALPCPEGARDLRFRAYSYGGPELRFAEGENTPTGYYYPIARAAVVDGTLCFEGFEVGAQQLSLRSEGGTYRDPDGGEHECVFHWTDAGQ